MWASVTNKIDLQNILMENSCDREKSHDTDEVRVVHMVEMKEFIFQFLL